MKRGCGILLHISSLPDGTFRSAFGFIEFLDKSNVKYWQILAMGPTDCADSPYSPISVFAGNPRFVDTTKPVDQIKFKLFLKENKYWLEPFAAYMAKKEPNKDHAVLQFQFFEQWAEIRKYANERGIQIIGDMPIYPAMESADVWGFQEQFDFVNGKPAGVAGVPPDYYNENGQLWGNPLYNFKQMTRDKFKWWRERIKVMEKMYDIVRIDHFRAFDSYYKVPFGSADAKNGVWCKGPGMKLFNAIKDAAPNLQIILEDLGDLTESVFALRDQTGCPGMRVMQFGFDGDIKNEHLCKNYPANCVAYIGTHDNDTFAGFVGSASVQLRQNIDNYLSSHRLGVKDTTRLAIEDILASRADLVILTMQDLLFQGSRFRMNIPGVATGNWKYKINSSDLSSDLCEYLKLLIERSGR